MTPSGGIAIPVIQAVLAPGGRGVTLTLASPLSGGTAYVVAATQDVTVRKRSREALEFLSRYKLARVVQEDFQQLERLALELQLETPSAKLTRAQVEFENAETNGRARRCSGLRHCDLACVVTHP